MGVFARSIILLLAVSGGPVWADSVLHDWADASNQEYREIKKLGPGVTAEQIRGVRRRVYEPVMVKGAAEGIDIYRKERGKLDSALHDVRAAMFPHLYNKGPQAKKGVAGGDNAAIGGGPPAPNAAATERGGGTGATEGGAGGKDVTFGGKRDKKKEAVNVDSDGIIH
jgi:hypothetical protein